MVKSCPWITHISLALNLQGLPNHTQVIYSRPRFFQICIIFEVPLKREKGESTCKATWAWIGIIAWYQNTELTACPMPALYQYLTHPLCTGYFLLHRHPWTWKDGLYKVRDNLTLTTRVNYHNWPMRNNRFLLELVICCYLPSRRALVTCSPFQAQSNFTMYFLQLFIDQVLCRANLLLLLGMLLVVQRRLIVPPP